MKTLSAEVVQEVLQEYFEHPEFDVNADTGFHHSFFGDDAVVVALLVSHVDKRVIIEYLYAKEKGKGHGTRMVSWIKKRFPGYLLLVYALEDSCVFWMKNSFQLAAESLADELNLYHENCHLLQHTTDDNARDESLLETQT